MSISNDISQQAGELNAAAKDAVRKVTDQLNDQANVLRDVTVAARYNAEDFIQTNPWQAVAIAAGIGFVVGVIIARR